MKRICKLHIPRHHALGRPGCGRVTTGPPEDESVAHLVYFRSWYNTYEEAESKHSQTCGQQDQLSHPPRVLPEQDGAQQCLLVTSEDHKQHCHPTDGTDMVTGRFQGNPLSKAIDTLPGPYNIYK